MTQNQIGSYIAQGNIWMNTGNWSGAHISLSTNVYSELSGLSTAFTLMSPANYFDMAVDGRLRYIGLHTRDFNVTGYCSQGAGGTPALAIYKNGSIVTGADTYDSGTSFVFVSAPVTLATNDYVSLYLKRNAAVNPSIRQVRLWAELTGGNQ